MGPLDVYRRLLLAILSMFALGTVASVSIGGAGSSAATAHRDRLQLTEAPKGAQSVLSVQKAMSAAKSQGKTETPRDVVVAGQIGGLPNIWPDIHPAYPWNEGQASFFLVDGKVAAQFAAHAKQHGGNHNCAFCRGLAQKNAHAVAIVNLVDERGEVIALDARELLGLKENQVVTVRGKARLLGGSMLVIDADGVFVQR